MVAKVIKFINGKLKYFDRITAPFTVALKKNKSMKIRIILKKTKAPERSEAFAVWTGLEPATPCVTGMYSNQLNYQTIRTLSLNVGGLDGTRTRDPMRDRHVF